MLLEMHCEYYIVRHKDWMIRLGFHGGTHDTHRAFLETIVSPGGEIEYIGDLLLPLKSDIDVAVGIGTRKYKDTIVVTCKHAIQMLTCGKQEKTFIEKQKEMIISTKRSQRELLNRKNASKGS